MSFMRCIPCLFVAVWTIISPGTTFAQNYPERNIRIITSAAGGGSDQMARIIAQGISSSLGQQLIVDNRGGSPVVPVGIFIKAPPDGYTLLYYAANLWLLPSLQDNVPYDPVRDFSPISLTVRSPSVLIVNPSLPANSVMDVINLAKRKPGVLNYASGAIGSTSHLSSEIFRSMAGIEIVRINYKGSAEALSSVMGGQVQLMFITAGEVAPHIKSGRVKALAVASAQPTALAPGLPTVAASGVPGYEWGTVHGLFARAKTPKTIIGLLHRELVQFMGRSEVKDRLFQMGLDVVVSTPEEFAATIKVDMERTATTLKGAGVRAN